MEFKENELESIIKQIIRIQKTNNWNILLSNKIEEIFEEIKIFSLKEKEEENLVKQLSKEIDLIKPQDKTFPLLKERSIQPLTENEFHKIPKYMKGRLSYIKINQFVKDINLVFKRNKGKNVFYITEKNIKEYLPTLKLDVSYRNMIIILRHLKRIKEIKKNGENRLFFL